MQNDKFAVCLTAVKFCHPASCPYLSKFNLIPVYQFHFLNNLLKRLQRVLSSDVCNISYVATVAIQT